MAGDGPIYRPLPLGRRGEFTSYGIPASGWAGGLIFFDLPTAAVHGAAVDFRDPPFANSYIVSWHQLNHTDFGPLSDHFPELLARTRTPQPESFQVHG